MLDVAEHSAYPRAKCKPRSLIGVFIPNGWFDWIEIRAVFEYFDCLTWPAPWYIAQTPGETNCCTISNNSKGEWDWDIYIMEMTRNHILSMSDQTRKTDKIPSYEHIGRELASRASFISFCLICKVRKGSACGVVTYIFKSCRWNLKQWFIYFIYIWYI